MAIKKQLRPSADKTRSAILKSATKLFAKKGFSGTAISEIAKAAKLPHQSLIYHHFQSKENLWNAVKMLIFDKYQHYCEGYPIKTNQELKETLRNIIESRFNFLKDNPEIMQIIRWQRLESSNTKLRTEYSIYSQNWHDFLRNLQETNKIRKKLKVDVLALLIFSLVQGAFEESCAIFQKDKEKVQDEYIELIIDVLYRALRNQ